MRVIKKAQFRKARKEEVAIGIRPCTSKGARRHSLAAVKTSRVSSFAGELVAGPVPEGIGIHYVIKRGVGIEVVDSLKKRIGLSDKQMAEYLGTSSATLQRKRTKRTNVSFVEGDRLYRLERILAKATELFRDEAAAAEWLKSPKFGLGGCTPFDLMETEAGAREVEDLLGRIQYGVIS